MLLSKIRSAFRAWNHSMPSCSQVLGQWDLGLGKPRKGQKSYPISVTKYLVKPAKICVHCILMAHKPMMEVNPKHSKLHNNDVVRAQYNGRIHNNFWACKQWLFQPWCGFWTSKVPISVTKNEVKPAQLCILYLYRNANPCWGFPKILLHKTTMLYWAESHDLILNNFYTWKEWLFWPWHGFCASTAAFPISNPLKKKWSNPQIYIHTHCNEGTQTHLGGSRNP